MSRLFPGYIQGPNANTAQETLYRLGGRSADVDLSPTQVRIKGMRRLGGTVAAATLLVSSGVGAYRIAQDDLAGNTYQQRVEKCAEQLSGEEVDTINDLGESYTPEEHALEVVTCRKADGNADAAQFLISD